MLRGFALPIVTANVPGVMTEAIGISLCEGKCQKVQVSLRRQFSYHTVRATKIRHGADRHIDGVRNSNIF
jgi:hypothetical protein